MERIREGIGSVTEVSVDCTGEDGALLLIADKTCSLPSPLWKTPRPAAAGGKACESSVMRVMQAIAATARIGLGFLAGEAC